MYETLEHWKQYKQEKDLQNKIAQEFELFNECGFQYKEKAKQLGYDKALDELCTKELSHKEFDKQLDEIAIKYGYKL
jgi:hypothetical protein